MGAIPVGKVYHHLRRWGRNYPGLVAKWLKKSYALLEFLSHPRAIRPFLYRTNQLERLMKEVKRRAKVVEVFCGPEALEKLLYLVLAQESEKLLGRRLRGFAETKWESYHAAGYTILERFFSELEVGQSPKVSRPAGVEQGVLYSESALFRASFFCGKKCFLYALCCSSS